MMPAFRNNLSLHGILLNDEPMAKHTSWRIGGTADNFYTPADKEDLADFMQQFSENENYLFLGLGSNLLVRDSGYRGTVISLKGCLSDIEVVGENRLQIGAGISCAKLARYCHRNDLLGGEFFAGIPGLLGGALAMNAGAFGAETWSLVRSVTTINCRGNICTRKPDEYEVQYRSVKMPVQEWFIGAELLFKKGDGNAAAQRVKKLMAQRAEMQPIGLLSCGSVFKNPHNDYAARLIEACGLKGYAIGDAVVSEKHANFIINRHQASARDVETLIKYIQKTVQEKQNVMLCTEVKIVGEAGNE